MTILATTGHRPDKLGPGSYGIETSRRLYWLAGNSLTSIKPDKVIVGMAGGWDQAVANAAIDLDIPVLAAIPHEGQEMRWPFAAQKRYRAILKRCDEVVMVTDGGYAPWKMQHRNQFMVDNCTVLLALWSGSSGGTANCINYARQKNIEIVNLWDQWVSLRERVPA